MMATATTDIFASALLDILPLPAWIVLILGFAIIGTAFVVMNKMSEEDTSIESTDIEERLERTIINSVETNGGRTNAYLINEATSNINKKIGKIVKVEENLDIAINEVLDLEDDEKTFTDYVAFTVLTGNTPKIFFKFIGYNLFYKLVTNERRNNKFAEYYFLPLEKLTVVDDGIHIDQGISLWKKNSLWRPKTRESQEVIQEFTFLDAHEDSMDTLQELAEVYSSFNTDFQKEKGLIDAKWENISAYKHQEDIKETKDAMKK